MMSELMAWAAGGAQGIPIHYSPRMDDPQPSFFIAIGKGFLAAS